MKEVLEDIKEKLLENIVFAVFLVVFLIYLVVDGAVAELAFVIVFPPWLVLSFSFFSVLFDWKLLESFRVWIVASVIFGVLATLLLLYLGWREELYVYVTGGVMIGLVVAIAEKVFSIGKR